MTFSQIWRLDPAEAFATHQNTILFLTVTGPSLGPKCMLIVFYFERYFPRTGHYFLD